MEQAIIVLICILIFIILVPAVLLLWIYIRDEKQEEHSVLRNYPVAGKLRYIFEKIGPELRQYLFSNDNEEQPFSRREYEQTVMSGKYKSRMMGFGSERDFDQPGYYPECPLSETKGGAAHRSNAEDRHDGIQD